MHLQSTNPKFQPTCFGVHGGDMLLQRRWRAARWTVIEAGVTRERINQKLLEKLVSKIEGLLTVMERTSLAEVVELYRKPRRMMWLSFTSGVARGCGIAVGFTIIGAVFLYVLGRVAMWNLPIIGEFVAEITRIVQGELSGP